MALFFGGMQGGHWILEPGMAGNALGPLSLKHLIMPFETGDIFPVFQNHTAHHIQQSRR